MRRNGWLKQRSVRVALVLGLVGLVAAFVAWSRRDPWPPWVVIRAVDRTTVGLGFTPDGLVHRAQGLDGVRAWDAATGQLVAGPTPAPVLDPVRSPDGRHFAGAINTGPYDPIELAWGDLATGVIRGRCSGPVMLLAPLRWADDGRTIQVLGSNQGGVADCAAFSWDRESGRVEVRPILGPPVRGGPGHRVLAGTEDGRTLAYHDAVDGSIRLWDAEADRPLGVIPAEEGRDLAPGPDATFSPDGRTLALAWLDGAVEAWAVAPPRRVGVIRFPRDRFRLSNLRVAPDGRTLALVVATVGPTWAERAWDRLQAWLDPRSVRPRVDVVVVDVAAGRVLARASGEDNPEFSPDGRWIATRDLRDPALVIRLAPRPAGP